MKKERKRFFLAPLAPLAPFVVFLSLFISCQTTPEIPDAVQGDSGFIPLEPGAQVYLFADVQKARPILDLMPIPAMNPKQSKEMLDRTRSVVAALYPPESGRRFQLTAWGSYPGLRAGMAFGADKNWKKLKSASGSPYWYSAASQLSVALNSKQAFVSASAGESPGDPFSAAPGLEAPEGFGEFRRGALFSCWLENPGPMVNRIFAAMQIPLQLPAERLFISLFPAVGQDGQYEALLRIQVSSAAQARALVTLFTLARGFISGGAQGAGGPEALAALLFANPPVQDGNNLNIKTAVLTEKEIALLFSLFPVYSG